MLYVHTLSINNMLKMNHRVARGRTQHISRNEGDMAYDASFQIYFISYMSLINTIFEIPTAKKHKGSNLVILLARKVRKMTRSLGKFAWIIFLTHRAVCAVAPSCINTAVAKQFLCLKDGTTWSSRSLWYQSLVAVHLINLFTVISSKKYGPRMKFNVNLHHTLTYGECNGCCCTAWGFEELHMGQFCVFTAPS